MDEYRPCRKPDCLRKVSLNSLYCCHACTTAGEASAPYEIEPYAPGLHWVLCHSAECEERKNQRGEYTVFEAESWPGGCR